jgi:hypothetical protein
MKIDWLLRLKSPFYCQHFTFPHLFPDKKCTWHLPEGRACALKKGGHKFPRVPPLYIYTLCPRLNRGGPAVNRGFCQLISRQYCSLINSLGRTVRSVCWITVKHYLAVKHHNDLIVKHLLSYFCWLNWVQHYSNSVHMIMMINNLYITYNLHTVKFISLVPVYYTACFT